MTANQVNYASVQVERVKVDELTRHNKAAEDLERERNNIAQQQADTDKWYKQQMTRLEEENQRMQERIATDKNITAKETAELQAMMTHEYNMIQEEYNARNVELGAQRNANERMSIEETNRHNREQERLGQLDIDLNSKRLEFEKYKFDTDVGFRDLEFGFREREVSNQSMKILNDYNLGLMNVAQQQRRNNLANEEFMFKQRQWDLQSSLQKQETTNLWFRTFMPFVLPTADAMVSGGAKLIDTFAQ